MTRYRIRCSKCKAEASVRGEEDPDTNSAEYDWLNADWEGGSESCDHEDFECVDVTYDDS